MKMMKYKLAFILAVLFFSAQASANVITDVENVNKTVGWWDSVSWTHDLSDTAFVPGTAKSATLSIQFSDDKDPWYDFLPELATIVVGKIDFQDGEILYSPVSNWSGSLGINSLASLNASGLLNVKVWSDVGDFYIGQSMLAVSTVPEPTTLMLMGIGLAGLGASRLKGGKRAK